ncbi:ceramidase [Photobacterium sp. DNB23_23_1]|uniref:Ceramidase n=1 Tax=Photobacterium pectinilyticum TaxID=2906793 RepID=A0ABT1N6J4_9GAMM|nr:ceramidase [Photobacterium sp. ZSDE20]MCQ1060355.1 ceramidase [Photobacterium sp. ZSDE20]MDD1826887.1 ceramidase [Photobacterium sp. ZSDE20]
MPPNFRPDDSSTSNTSPSTSKRSLFDWRYILLIAIALALGVMAIYFSPIRQSRNFYDYADQRLLFGIPHFWNVVSNLGFLIVGIIGLRESIRNRLVINQSLSFAYQLFFISLIGAFLGSSLYHLSPGPFTLMIDRIPITISFICLYCIILAEYLSPTLGRAMLLPTLAYGVLSVIYWYMTDVIDGRGDMAPYVLVQLLPIIHIPLIIWLYPNSRNPTRYYFYALGLYVLCKLAESNDDEIYELTSQVSGHFLKHILAALAGYCVYLGWKAATKKPRI